MRVVLDTNTIISALLFTGTASRIVPLWQSGKILPLVSGPILEEYLRVLAYPKFALEEEEIRRLIEAELIAYAEAVRVRTKLVVVRRDPDDDKFLECAVSGRAQYLVTGHKDLLEIGSFRGIKILNAGDFLSLFES